MSESTPGLHHVTAICGDPRVNRRFYTERLGLRLVKRTVNFDAPETYHLYYGDDQGRPGTALTFFPFVQAGARRPGVGETARVAWAVRPDSLSYWAERLGGDAGAPEVTRGVFGDRRLDCVDPHGLAFSLVEADWMRAEGVSSEGALGPFFGVALAVRDYAPTAGVLAEVFGYTPAEVDGATTRFIAAAGPGPGAVVDVRVLPDGTGHRSGRGSVHHIAFRARDAAHQADLRARAAAAGLSPTPVIDRRYFQSVYFREPGGVLFEIATDGPGFAVDESVETLGEALQLPPQYEPRRAQIEAALPPI